MESGWKAAAQRQLGGSGEGWPSPDSCAPPLPPPRERGLGGEGGSGGPGRETRMPLSLGYLPLSDGDGRRGALCPGEGQALPRAPGLPRRDRFLMETSPVGWRWARESHLIGRRPSPSPAPAVPWRDRSPRGCPSRQAAGTGGASAQGRVAPPPTSACSLRGRFPRGARPCRGRPWRGSVPACPAGSRSRRARPRPPPGSTPPRSPGRLWPGPPDRVGGRGRLRPPRRTAGRCRRWPAAPESPRT